MLKKSWVRGGGGQGRYEQKIEVTVTCKIAKKVEGDPVQWWGGGQSGCERRIKVIVKMQNEKKKVGVGSSLRGAEKFELL